MRLKVRQFQSQTRGDAADAVLIHGTGANATLWRPQIKLLVNSGYRCIVPELRGHGKSPEPGESTDLAVHTEDMIETLEGLDLKYPAVFVGHSLGAMVSISLAQKRPEMVKKILAVSLPGRVLKPLSFAFKWFLTWPIHSIRDTVIHRNLSRRHRILVSTNVHSLKEIIKNFESINYMDEPPDVHCPLHLSVGRLDPIALSFYLKQINERLENSTLQIFEFAGHSCMDDRPGEFNDWFMEKVNS